ncbi:MAG: hypothetical protein ACE5OO_01995 [Candidatus Bathyarchaeia archaeon]
MAKIRVKADEVCRGFGAPIGHSSSFHLSEQGGETGIRGGREATEGGSLKDGAEVKEPGCFEQAEDPAPSGAVKDERM